MANQYAINAVFALTGNIQGQVKAIEKEVLSVQQAWKKSVDAASGRLQQFGNNALAVTKLIGAGALMKGAQVAVKEWVSFDKATTESIALFKEFQKGTPEYEASFKALGNAAREVGAVTEFTASDAAGALSKMAMAGMSSEKSIELLMGTTNLATAAGLDLERAVDIVTD